VNLLYGRLVEISDEDGIQSGKIEVDGASKKVALGLLTDVTCGDTLLVCDGVAISKVQQQPEVSAMNAPTLNINEEKLNKFLGQAISELGAAMNVALVITGDRLGLYKAMAGAGPMTSEELAKKTGTDERYVREWISAQAAGGFIEYDPKTNKFTLADEQAMALAVDDSPCFLPGAFQLISSVITDEPKLRAAFKSGKGVGWHEHGADLFEGTERFFRPGYAAHLVSEWIPALEGIEARLKEGGKVADVGCGHGASTLLMAKAFPKSEFTGFDYHDASIKWAQAQAEKAGIADRVKFKVAKAKEFPGSDYTLVTTFDCLHDMGDPAGAASHVRQSLAKDGVWMIVEPIAGDKLEDNLNPIGRMYYGASTMICTPASRDQEVGLALGAQAGEKRLRDVVMSGGFSSFRRATQTPFNLIFEAKP
jgi:2-polyprenyl-3-methyl-5-hydroxy-6-metoxy-1,4-benzoquinol methylase/hydrogenase maturation factor